MTLRSQRSPWVRSVEQCFTSVLTVVGPSNGRDHSPTFDVKLSLKRLQFWVTRNQDDLQITVLNSVRLETHPILQKDHF